jgi:hypothetical protein
MLFTDLSCERKTVDQSITTKECTTPLRLTPGHLVNPGYLLYKTSNKPIINSIAGIRFQNMKVKKDDMENESRFVMLFKKNNSSADTLDFIDNKKVLHQDGSLFEYPYNFLDSLKKLIKIEKIDCD